MKMSEESKVETTDSWSFGKILKHTFWPKPKGAPKAGKKEIATRICVAGIFAIIAISIFGGTSGQSCSAPETKQTLLSILKENYPVVEQSGAKLQIDGVRTTSENEKTHAKQCSAQLIATGRFGSKSMSIQYKTEITDDKKQFFVTLLSCDGGRC